MLMYTIMSAFRVFRKSLPAIDSVHKDAKVRQITRHETATMTEHYSDFHLEDFREVAEAQESLGRLLLEKGETPLAES